MERLNITAKLTENSVLTIIVAITSNSFPYLTYAKLALPTSCDRSKIHNFRFFHSRSVSLSPSPSRSLLHFIFWFFFYYKLLHIWFFRLFYHNVYVCVLMHNSIRQFGKVHTCINCKQLKVSGLIQATVLQHPNLNPFQSIFRSPFFVVQQLYHL